MNYLKKNYKVIESNKLNIGDKILTTDGSKVIKKIISIGKKNCYDINITSNKKLFLDEPNFILANNIVSHNCNLQVVNDAHKLVLERRGKNIDWDSIDLNDSIVYKNIIQNHDHFGIFQYESTLARQLMKSISPSNFEELSAVSSLLRPGPLRMGMHTEFADRKYGRKIEGIDYEAPECIKDILGYTYYIIVYQEQIMKIAQKIGGFNNTETNAFRKALVKYGKSVESESKRYAQVESYHDRFIEEASKPQNLGDKFKAQQLWETIQSFSAYGFNRTISFDEFVEEKTLGLITIKEVVEAKKNGKNIIIKSFDGKNNIWVEVTKTYDHGIQDLVEVELEDGKKIKCTLNHKFQTSEGMLSLSEILNRDLELIIESENE